MREQGALRGVVTTERSDVAQLLKEFGRSADGGRALVDEVTCRTAYEVPPPGGESLAIWRSTTSA